jgi:IS5 family transposase
VKRLVERLKRITDLTDTAADRGMSAASNERALEEMGVKQIALPKRGKLTPARITHQKQRWFRSLQSWRAGIEGTISLLKRKYGMRRTRLRGHRGARCWVAGWFGLII